MKSKGEILAEIFDAEPLEIIDTTTPFERIADKFLKAIAADLPADADAFLGGIEHYAAKGEGADLEDTRKLCDIIRKMAAEIKWLRDREERMRPIDLVASHLSLSIDVNTLRSQLTRLQSETRDALNLLGPEYFDDGKPLAELGRLVNIKGES